MLNDETVENDLPRATPETQLALYIVIPPSAIGAHVGEPSASAVVDTATDSTVGVVGVSWSGGGVEVSCDGRSLVRRNSVDVAEASARCERISGAEDFVDCNLLGVDVASGWDLGCANRCDPRAG